MNNSPKAYISGPLTAAVDLSAARNYYSHLATICQREGFDPYVPHLRHDPVQHPDIPAELVYQQDLDNLLAADVIVAYVGAASSGAGAELAIAVAHGLPIVAISRPGERISRFLLGMLRTSRGFELVASDGELDDCLPSVLRNAVRSATEATTGSP